MSLFSKKRWPGKDTTTRCKAVSLSKWCQHAVEHMQLNTVPDILRKKWPGWHRKTWIYFIYLIHIRNLVKCFAKFGWCHQLFAPVKPAESIYRKVIGGIVVGMLDWTPKCSEQIAHSPIELHMTIFFCWWFAIKICRQHFLILRITEVAFGREIAQISHMIVHPGIFSIHYPHTVAIVEEVLTVWIAMTQHKRHRFACKRFVNGPSLAIHKVIAIWQFDNLYQEYVELIIDHCKEFEAKWEFTAVELPHYFSQLYGQAFAHFEAWINRVTNKP